MNQISETQIIDMPTKLSDFINDTGFVASTSVRNIVILTQAQYDALATKDANTEYNIIESV